MNTLELLKDNTWFNKYPEKIAGVEYETSGFMFPIMVRGSKEDVLRVIHAENKEDVSDIELELAEAEAQAIKIKLNLAKLKL
jgi:hypothetical protein